MTGFINIDKREDFSSAAEVSKIKWLSKEKCGHMGTLDPMASGVLPIAIGNAARLFDYLLTKTKVYVATFKFGVDSDTLDTTGNLTKSGDYVPSKQEIESVLGEFIGEISQVPPKYSAKNIAGKRGYELARAGVEFELKPKVVTINSIKLLEKCSDDEYKFEIDCGGGTYIRAIARDIAARLDTCAVMSSLIRTKSGVFTIDNSVKTTQLTKENYQNYIISTESVTPFEQVYVEGNDAKKVLCGVGIESGLNDGLYKIYLDSNFYGIAEVKNSILKARTKLC